MVCGGCRRTTPSCAPQALASPQPLALPPRLASLSDAVCAVSEGRHGHRFPAPRHTIGCYYVWSPLLCLRLMVSIPQGTLFPGSFHSDLNSISLHPVSLAHSRCLCHTALHLNRRPFELLPLCVHAYETESSLSNC